MSTDREALQQKIENVPWRALRGQAGQDVYILVDSAIDIAEVGVAVVDDNTVQVETWVRTGQVGKPTLENLAAWDQAPDKIFRTLITHPYVLIQESFDH